MYTLTISDIPNNTLQQRAAESLFQKLAHERVRLVSGSLDYNSSLSYSNLIAENDHFSGTGGVSQNNYQYGFIPAFRNEETGQIILSKTANGKVAPIHILEGIPKTWFKKNLNGSLVLMDVITSGFVRQGMFYTREGASNAVKILNL